LVTNINATSIKGEMERLLRGPALRYRKNGGRKVAWGRRKLSSARSLKRKISFYNGSVTDSEALEIGRGKGKGEASLDHQKGEGRIGLD